MEVFCDNESHDIVRLEVFSSVDRPTPYLEEIDLDDLFV